MLSFSRLFFAALTLTLVAGISAQQPAKPPPPPPLPPINPANARLDQTITGLDGPGFDIASSSQSDVLIAGCEGGALLTWRKDALLGIRSGSGTGDILRGHQGAVLRLAWNGGPMLASAGADRKLLLWRLDDGKPAFSLDLPALPRALAMSPDGKLAASGGEDGAVQLWDVAAGKPLANLKEHGDWITALTFSPDGKQLASAAYNGTILLWDVTAEAPKKIVNLPLPPNPPPKDPPPPSPVHALEFSPDGKSLAVGYADANLHLLSLPDGKLLRPFPGHQSAVSALAFHPSGTMLASASKDRTVRLWNPANAQPFKVLEGHTAWVDGLAFLFQGTRLASVSADQTVKLWDLTDPPKK